MAKAEQAIETKTQCVEAACVELEEAVKDRRENGGDKEVVRAKTFSLIALLFDNLET